MPESVVVTTEGPVRTVRLNRSSKGNAFDEEMLYRLDRSFQEIESDDTVRAVVLAAEGSSFSTGGDLAYLAPFADLSAAEVAERVYTLFSKAVRGVMSCSRPVVVAVNGPALGAGCDLALAADIRVAGPAAAFAESWINLGTLPALGGMFLLPRIIGLGRATEAIMTGRRIQAEEALAIGLVSEVLPADALYERAIEIATGLAERPSRALQLVKRGLSRAASNALAAELEWAAVAQSTLISSAVFKEGVTAAMERRPAKFAPAEGASQ